MKFYILFYSLSISGVGIAILVSTFIFRNVSDKDVKAKRLLDTIINKRNGLYYSHDSFSINYHDKEVLFYYEPNGDVLFFNTKVKNQNKMELSLTNRSFLMKLNSLYAYLLPFQRKDKKSPFGLVFGKKTIGNHPYFGRKYKIRGNYISFMNNIFSHDIQSDFIDNDKNMAGIYLKGNKCRAIFSLDKNYSVDAVNKCIDVSLNIIDQIDVKIHRT